MYLQIDALGEVVEAVRGRVEVYLDGGVRQGTDVLKVLALGAMRQCSLVDQYCGGCPIRFVV